MLVRLATSVACILVLPGIRAQTAADLAQSAVQAVAGNVTARVTTGQQSTAVAIQADTGGLILAAPSLAGETLLTLDIGFGIRLVRPSRVTVPEGENLRIAAPALGGGIQWRKNGKPIPGQTNATLQLNPVQAGDAGNYDAVYTDPAMSGRGSQGLVLGVGAVSRLLNLSSRVTLNAGPNQAFMSGFIVSAAEGTSKKLIIRAIGPSLGAFGVSNPLKKPVLRIYDGNGKPYQNGYVYAAVVGGVTYSSDLAESLARAGAFPIPAGSDDAVLMMPFLPGTYTAEVSSGDLSGGMVLLEIYEVP